MNILVISGEQSSDVYAAKLAQELKTRDSTVNVFGIGANHLQKELGSLVHKTGAQHTFGISSYLFTPKHYKVLLDDLSQFLAKTKIQKAIIFDFQYINSKIASILKSFDCEIITFITPNTWIYNDIKQGKKIRDYSSKILAIYEGEYHFYKKLNATCFYVGHPLISVLPTIEEKQHNPLPVISVLPGSRSSEIKAVLPEMLETIKIIQKKIVTLKTYVSISNDDVKQLILELIEKSNLKNITLWKKDPHELLTQSNLVLIRTGTATLQALFYKTPMIVFGKLSTISYFIGKYILRIKVPFIALPNIIANKKIVPEYLQYKIKPEEIAKKSVQILTNTNTHQINEIESLIRTLRKKEDPIKLASEIILDLESSK